MKPLQHERRKVPIHRDPPRSSHENDHLLGTMEEWEDSVFLNAAYFTVCIVTGNRYESRVILRYNDWPTAVAVCKGVQERFRVRGALVYAVTEQERFVCLISSRWPHYQKLWEGKHGRV
jgi:hypothetical protein